MIFNLRPTLRSGLWFYTSTFRYDNKCLRTIDYLFSLRSTMVSHGEGSCLQNHLCRRSLCPPSRPLCAPNHNCHKACCPQAKDNHHGTIWSNPFHYGPGLDTALRPLFFSVLFWDFQPCLDVQVPENPTGQASLQAKGPLSHLFLSHISDCTSPTQSGALVLPYRPAPAPAVE